MAICLTCGKNDCNQPLHRGPCPRCNIRTKCHKSETCKPCAKRTFDTEKDRQVIELYKQGWLIKDIASRFNVTRFVISGILDRANIERRPMSETKAIYHIDETFFDEIDNEQKAYWYGFLAADGWTCISCNKYSLNLELKYSDRKHIQLFKSHIQSDHPILIRTQNLNGKRHKSARVSIGNKHLVETLIALGIIPGKHETFRFPDQLPHQLYHHFIRGYYDGDGSLSHNRQGNYVSPTFSIVGNEPLLTSIQSILMSCCDVSKTSFSHKKGTDVVSLVYRGPQILRILEHLYCDATVYLPRKHKRYQTLVSRNTQRGVQ